MQLHITIEDLEYTLEVPDDLVHNGEEFFARIDADLDKGQQMGRQWRASLNLEDRIRIVGDRLLSTLERENHATGRMLAAYILNRAPTIARLDLDTSGEPQETEIHYRT
jgi:hypothetical protein